MKLKKKIKKKKKLETIIKKEKQEKPSIRAYKIQILHEFKPNNKVKINECTVSILNNIDENENFLENTLR